MRTIDTKDQFTTEGEFSFEHVGYSTLTMHRRPDDQAYAIAQDIDAIEALAIRAQSCPSAWLVLSDVLDLLSVQALTKTTKTKTTPHTSAHAPEKRL